MSERRADGPIDSVTWPAQLVARVVTPGAEPRIHGYAVEDDLARHYGLGENVLLTLTGRMPSDADAAALGAALAFSMPVHVGESPVHAAVVARMCGATPGGVLGVGVLALTEQARSIVEATREAVTWAADPAGPPPESVRARDANESASVARLAVALARYGRDVPELEADLSRDAAIVVVLHRVGLEHDWQKETALVLARLPALSAEAHAAAPGSFREYPMDLPAFRYRDPDR